MHCTGGSQKQGVADLMAEFKAKGWKSPGYHYVVLANGEIEQLCPTDKVANGVKGYNSTSVHVAYVGGIDTKGKVMDNRTTEQKEALKQILSHLRTEFPNAKILGHRDISPDKNKNGKVDVWERIKGCPCFDAQTEYKDL